MKSAIILGAGLLSGAMAQGACGTGCISAMQGLASDLGCTAGDNACLCRNPNFAYGIRDCSFQSCADASDAEAAVAAGIELCRQAGVVVTVIPGATVTQPTGTSTVTAVPVVSSIFSEITSGGSTITTLLGVTTLAPSVSGGSESATPSPVSTSTFTTIVTSGESTITSVGETTLFGVGGVPGATSLPQTAVTTEPVVSTITSGGSVITSTVGSTTVLSSLTGGEASSALSSQASEATGATTTANSESGTATGTATGTAASSSSSGLAKQTAVPVAGFLAAAGFVAMLI
ncbi:CFEM domain-containing protein [Colletotrichum orchidophilum]|uniref:CFEM domain-containing protein n=1 Tax=Colletotrichum orchidophilum TaxID=1209926 RepID=A0A1G4AU57_9PEZI|nr:CFEM domain-containing protein [Colletotrichum orchidophilum]OHE92623.1 CFEM domain-containing protein [Colletotrichum orchidophilum]